MHVVRTLIGLLFIGHGLQKLFGWFGGSGPEGTGAAFESMGMRPGRRNAILAGVAETAGGTLLALDVAKPLAAAHVTGTMVTAIRTAHLPKGLWITEGGFEYNLVLIAAVFDIVAEDEGLSWAVGALAAGVLGSEAVAELSRRHAEHVEQVGGVAEPEQAPAGAGP